MTHERHESETAFYTEKLRRFRVVTASLLRATTGTIPAETYHVPMSSVSQKMRRKSVVTAILWRSAERTSLWKCYCGDIAGMSLSEP